MKSPIKVPAVYGSSKGTGSPAKMSTASILQDYHPTSTSIREEVRIQHGTDVLTFETDSDGNVPVSKIDAVLSHVVALKYRLPQKFDHGTDGFDSRPHSREG